MTRSLRRLLLPNFQCNLFSIWPRSCYSKKSAAGRVEIMRVLHVAEKPDAAKRIATILSRQNMRNRAGRSKYNRIFEFQADFRGQANCEMAVTSVSGHLLEMDFSPEFNRWRDVLPSELFRAAVLKRVSNNGRPIGETLEMEARTAQALVIWTDCDREGENIGFEIIDVCQRVNRRLAIYRARFSEITTQSIERAFVNLVQPDKRLSDAVDCRSELDLRIGAAFTRLQTLFVQRNVPAALDGRPQQPISYGSCQFPTLGFVVDRFRRNRDFIAEPFWKLRVLHTKDGLQVEFRWDRVHLFDEQVCRALHTKCQDAGSAIITSVLRKPTSKWRPVAMDTVSMEKLASRHLRFTAKNTLNIAEKLYNRGFISYPRTETNKFSKEVNLIQLVQMQTVDQRWGQFATDVLQRGPNPRNGNKSDEAHPPIHPTKHAGPVDKLTEPESQLYELIVRHFLACLSRNAAGNSTTVELELAEEKFAANGLIVTDSGYLQVYGRYERWTDKPMPGYVQGDRLVLNPDNVEMNEGRTTAPSLLTEAELIGLMDKHGIGTDATHADHIQTIQDRLYAGKNDDKRFVPGYLGLGLVEGYDDMGYALSKPNLRAELEADLKRICDGSRTKAAVLAFYVEKYRTIFEGTERMLDRLAVALRKYFDNNGQAPPAARGGGGRRGDDDDDDGGGGGGGGDDGGGGAGAAGEQEASNDGPTALSNPQTVSTCRKCNSAGWVIRCSRRTEVAGNFFLGCSSYPQCDGALWLPRGQLATCQLVQTLCRKCRPPTRKVRLTFKANRRPAEIRTATTTLCLLCDLRVRAWIASCQNN